jgi:hypothetical protein
MTLVHLEFPFVEGLEGRGGSSVRRVGGAAGKTGEPVRKESRRSHRKEMQRQARKSRASRVIVQVVEMVAKRRGVKYQAMISLDRGTPAAADARVLAMGLCCALEVEQFIVARAFNRDWATIYSAQVRCSSLYGRKANKAFRKEWDELFSAVADGAG